MQANSQDRRQGDCRRHSSILFFVTLSLFIHRWFTLGDSALLTGAFWASSLNDDHKRNVMSELKGIKRHRMCVCDLASWDHEFPVPSPVLFPGISWRSAMGRC